MTGRFIPPHGGYRNLRAYQRADRQGIEHHDLVICANVILGLIKVTDYLLDQQIR